MTQYARPDDDVGSTDWTDQDMGYPASYTMIDQDPVGDCSVYIIASDTGDSLTAKFGLQDVTDPESASGHKLVIEAGGQMMMSAVPELTYALYQGTTVRATKTFTPSDGSFATDELTLTPEEANSITDYTDLQIWLTQAAGDGGGDEDWVCQAYFECPDAPAAATTSPAFLIFVDC